jgi:hypothetical protein
MNQSALYLLCMVAGRANFPGFGLDLNNVRDMRVLM